MKKKKRKREHHVWWLARYVSPLCLVSHLSRVLNSPFVSDSSCLSTFFFVFVVVCFAILPSDPQRAKSSVSFESSFDEALVSITVISSAEGKKKRNRFCILVEGHYYSDNIENTNAETGTRNAQLTRPTQREKKKEKKRRRSGKHDTRSCTKSATEPTSPEQPLTLNRQPT